MRRDEVELLVVTDELLEAVRRMRLCKPSIHEAYEAWISDLADLGFEMLGSGTFSTVVSCPWDQSKVIKIGLGEDAKESISEDGWLAYAKFCMENPDTPLIPRIHGLHAFPEHNLFVACLDKLQEVTAEEDTLLDALEDAARNGYDLRDTQYVDQLSTEAHLFGKRLFEAGMSEPNDLGWPNVMQTEQGDIVITDPIGWSDNAGEVAKWLGSTSPKNSPSVVSGEYPAAQATSPPSYPTGNVATRSGASGVLLGTSWDMMTEAYQKSLLLGQLRDWNTNP